MNTLRSPEFLQRKSWWGLALLGLFAMIIRLIAIGQESFWTDEVLTLNVLRKGVWQGLCAFETSPPLYFLLLKGWSLIFGEGHVALRTFSVLAGGLAVPALWICARRWGLGGGLATVTALLLAISPFACLQSQQNRYYAMMMLFGIVWLATLPALLVREREPRVHWPFVLAGVVCFYTHYYFLFLFFGGAVGLGLWWLCENRTWRSAKGMIKSFLVLGALAFFDMPLFLHQLHLANNWWLEKPNSQALRAVFTQMFWIGPSVSAAGWRLHTIEALRWLALAGYALYLVRIALGRGGAAARHALLNGLVFACIGILPILAGYVYSIQVNPIFIADRYPLLFLPGFLMWAAVGWDGLPRRLRPVTWPLILAAMLVLSTLSIWSYWTTFQAFDWRGGIRTINSQWREGDAMAFCPMWMVDNYLKNGGEVRNGLESQNVDSLTQAGRVWLFMWEQAPAESKRPELQSLRHEHGDQVIIQTPDTTLSLIDMAKK